MKQYAASFSDLCIMVFKELCHIPVSPGDPYTTDTSEIEEWDITAIIGLAGSARGVVSLSINTDAALTLTGKLTGQTYTQIDRDVFDVLGEIANVIAGRAKQIMEEEFRFETALPLVAVRSSIISLRNGTVNSLPWPSPPLRSIRIPFTIFENGSFLLSISVQCAK
jgi:chemotaxis protein CheX